MKEIAEAFNKEGFSINYTDAGLSIKLMRDYVLVKAEEEKVDESKFTIREIHESNSPMELTQDVKQGRVVALGEGVYDYNGKLKPFPFKVGDQIIYKWADKMIIMNGEYDITHGYSVIGFLVQE